MAVRFSPAEVASLAVMSPKRLVVCEATLAETATSQRGTLPSAEYVLAICRCRSPLRTFVRKFSNIDFFLQILPLKDDELVMSEM